MSFCTRGGGPLFHDAMYPITYIMGLAKPSSSEEVLSPPPFPYPESRPQPHWEGLTRKQVRRKPHPLPQNVSWDRDGHGWLAFD